MPLIFINKKRIAYQFPDVLETGKVVRLILEINPEVPGQIEEFEAISFTNPSSIAEFLIRLNELQKNNRIIL